LPTDRDVAAFDERAPTYETGWNGRMHVDIARRTAALARAARPDAVRVLDVGCGTGLVLRELATRLPGAETLVGIDPALRMVEVARSRSGSGRDDGPVFDRGVAEALPYADGSFDLVVSAVSFHHWKDQGAGLKECGRVLAPGGRLVLTDLFARGLVRYPWHSGGRRTVTRRRAGELLDATGFSPPEWHRIYAFIIWAAVASKAESPTR
jgi:ubiquinone/menaquinone biosynthesis C-methylase UbiE